MNEIQKKEKYEIGQSLFISNNELMNYGCLNCIWKLHGQCPKKLTGDETHIATDKEGNSISGYCEEIVTFITNLAEGEDSISAVWEKFGLYVSRLQSLKDYKEFMTLDAEIKKLEESPDLNKKKIDTLMMKRDSFKLWWIRLNDQVLKSLGKIVDREQKVDVVQHEHKISLSQIHKLADAAKKQIESKE